MTENETASLSLVVGMLRGLLLKYPSILSNEDQEKIAICDKIIEDIFYKKDKSNDII